MSEDIELSVNLAEQVNDILTDYIAIHDSIFRFSIRRIIPISGIFKAIDFQGYASSLTEMLDELNEIDATAGRFSDANTPPTRLFLVALREYSSTLADTIAQLRTLCQNLHLKSQRSMKFSLSQHNRAVEGYKASLENYRILGDRLNELLIDAIHNELLTDAIHSEAKMNEPINIVRVHVLDPLSGYTMQKWTIGEDIDAETVEQFLDAESGDIYAMIHYEDGEEKTHVMAKHFWEEARRQLDAI